MKTYIDQAEQHLLHTYNRYPIVWERGEGCYLYDADGKKYLDFVAGIGVFALGYGNKTYNDAVKAQLDKITHVSNYYYNMPAIKAAERLTALTGIERVFFTNSGAEAVEGAIKAARKYAYTRDGHSDHEIIAFHNSFHGRTMGALSITGTEKYRTPFEPLIGNIIFSDFNDYEEAVARASEKTCAIILETVQGEGGIHPAGREFLPKIKAFCDEKDILLILDEIQCGLARSGTLYAYEQYDVKPDILTTAKALGGGIPVGAFLMSERVAEKSLVAGDHGTTFGGNPLACAAVGAVLDLLESEEIIDRVSQTAPYLVRTLDQLAAKHSFIHERRGLGLLQGLECAGPVAPIINYALENGLAIINAGEKVLRFIPPLIVSKAQIDEMAEILDKGFGLHEAV
ncbi:MAG: aspartate aminotransferase family protein [Lachnospiraceae bacterium]|jgi:acetylornithine/N-succinyldiaminopimelate aminotransferase|nr:aspartate aminotransferase family protein [Lachnospiraceae bacterium]